MVEAIIYGGDSARGEAEEPYLHHIWWLRPLLGHIQSRNTLTELADALNIEYND